MNVPIKFSIFLLVCISSLCACVETVYIDPEEDIIRIPSADTTSNPYDPIQTQDDEEDKIESTETEEESTEEEESEQEEEDIEAEETEESEEDNIDDLGQFPTYAIEMLNLVNEFRRTGGRCGQQEFPGTTPLILNELLNQAAQMHAEDMANQRYFSLVSLDGKTSHDRVIASGYVGQAYIENIAAGQEEARNSFEQWRNSAVQCEYMLSNNFNELGVGFVSQPNSQFKFYWVQTFARR